MQTSTQSGTEFRNALLDEDEPPLQSGELRARRQQATMVVLHRYRAEALINQARIASDRLARIKEEA